MRDTDNIKIVRNSYNFKYTSIDIFMYVKKSTTLNSFKYFLILAVKYILATVREQLAILVIRLQDEVTRFLPNNENHLHRIFF